MIRFYAPEIENNPVLPEAESGHAVRVLRKRPGDEVEVVDGHGGLYRCVLVSDHPKAAGMQIIEKIMLPKVWKPFITLAVAPTKHSDRMEWLLEKAVEIGIDRFVPLLTARSERKQLKTERLEKIAVSAMKQSLKATLPEITEMIPLAEAVRIYPAQQQFVGYCDDNTPRRLLADACRPDIDTNILIGPEGDFSPEEIAMLIENGYTPVTMGDNRLRTETAALVAATTLHVINQLHSR